MTQALTDLLKHPAIWRVGQVPASVRPCLPTGFAALDRVLPAQGWEQGSMSEILANEQGIGELSLLVPALRQCTLQGRNVVLVAPPYVPFPHAWESSGIALSHVLLVRAEGADLLWAIEQAARSSSCGMVIGWTATCRKELNYQALRRLQVAADKGGAALFLFRAESARDEASPAPTRLSVNSKLGELHLRVFKRRGALLVETIRANTFPEHWRRRTVEAIEAAAKRNDAAHGAGVLVPLNSLSPKRRISASR